jgi:hypothetical protein
LLRKAPQLPLLLQLPLRRKKLLRSPSVAQTLPLLPLPKLPLQRNRLPHRLQPKLPPLLLKLLPPQNLSKNPLWS